MLEEFMHWLGFGLCHQLPERSFAAGGLQLPVCARDTGIYVGFVISLMVMAVLHRRERPRGFPSTTGWVFVCVLVAMMAWDGISSYAGFRSTTNDLRLFTGLAAGFAASVVVLPMVNDGIWKAPGAGRVLEPASRLAFWIFAFPVSFVVIRQVGPLLGTWYAIFVACCILVTLSAINLVLIATLSPFERKAVRYRDVVPAAAVSLLLAFAEVWLAGRLNAFLLGIASGLGS